VGGAESYASQLTEQLSLQEDFELHVFANRWSTENHDVTFHKVPIIPYPRFLRPLSFARSVGNQIAAKPFDLIHSHERASRMDILSMHGIPHVTWMKKVRQKRLSLFDRTTA
jgi:UDP-glucose:(heptosyl)LPS alpha-1,3-glucosyltransferase